MKYPHSEKQNFVFEELQDEITVVTESEPSNGTYRRLTSQKDAIERFKKEIKGKAIEWTKARDIKLLQLAKKYGS